MMLNPRNQFCDNNNNYIHLITKTMQINKLLNFKNLFKHNKKYVG